MVDEQAKSRTPRPGVQFPLASLALLVAALAAALACVDFPRWREQYGQLAAGGLWRPLVLFGVAGLVGALFGLPYALSSRLGWRSRLFAPVAGYFAGQVGVLVLLAPGPIWKVILAVGVLLAAATVFRLGAE